MAQYASSRHDGNARLNVLPGADAEMAGVMAERLIETPYKVKNQGRNRIPLWAPGVHSNAPSAAAAAPIVSTARWSANNMHARSWSDTQR